MFCGIRLHVQRLEIKARAADLKEMNMKSLKTIGIFLAVTHFFEALTAVQVAKKKGESPVKYFGLTLFAGVFVLIPLMRKPNA